RPVTVMFAPALMEVAPVRLVPVRVTGTVRLAGLDVGLMLVRVGTMANGTELLAPFGPETEICCVVALMPTTNVALIWLPLTTVKLDTVIPPPGAVFTEVTPVKPWPVRVTGTVVLAVAVVGAIVLISGASANTVKVTGLLVLPVPGVVTVMLCGPSSALP